jgi:ectoine hydroxylase-related dioxygenase (phytanoyl-CoA dioxygenase family)
MSAQLAETKTSEIDLSSEYTLTADQIADYQRDGHIILRGLASREELDVYQPAISGAADRYNVEHRPLDQRDTYGKAFLQIMNLWVKDEAVRRFTLAKRFAKVAADLMGVDGVRLYHDQALFKEPGGGPTPWHQDQGYWPLATDNTVTMWMPLVNVPAEVGSMVFGSGSQKLGYLGDLPISDKSDAEFEKFVNERHIAKKCYGAMTAGDATFHAGWTLHCAPGNPTPNMREVMTIIYVADGVRCAEPANAQQASDLKGWLPGCKPGDLAASELNPLLYKR